MSRRTKIDKLPPEIRDRIAEMRGRAFTIDEIMAQLRALGLPQDALPARSGLGRHIQSLDKLIAQLNLGRDIAKAIVMPLSKEPESKQTRLNIEVMHILITRLLAAIGAAGDGEMVEISAKEAKLLASTLRDLAAARRLDMQTTLDLAGRAPPKAEAGGEADRAAEAADFQIPDAAP